MKKITLVFVLLISSVVTTYAYPINFGIGRIWGCFGGCFKGGGVCISDDTDPFSPTRGDLLLSASSLSLNIPPTSVGYADLGASVTFDANTPIDPIVATALGATEGNTFYINAGTYPVLYAPDGTATIYFPYYADVCKK